jgi:hypothetical protein
MFSNSGHTEGAKKRAAGAAPKIELEVTTLSEAEDFDWDEFLNDGCQVEECFGIINWHFSTAGSQAGHCSTCGTFHICCGECGTIDWYHEGSLESCSGGTMKFRLVKERGDTVDIAEISPEKKEDTGERSSESQDSPDLGDLD